MIAIAPLFFPARAKALSIGIKRGAVDDLGERNTLPNEDRQIQIGLPMTPVKLL
jgi:hypothetical protein